MANLSSRKRGSSRLRIINAKPKNFPLNLSIYQSRYNNKNNNEE